MCACKAPVTSALAFWLRASCWARALCLPPMSAARNVPPMGSAVAPAGTVTTMLDVPWTSDGARSFRFSVEAQAGHGDADVLISVLRNMRTWPVVAGFSAIL